MKYIINLDAPVAKWKTHYTSLTPNANNHDLTEFSHPELGALATGTTGLLLSNYFVEQCLMNCVCVFRSPECQVLFHCGVLGFQPLAGILVYALRLYMCTLLGLHKYISACAYYLLEADTALVAS